MPPRGRRGRGGRSRGRNNSRNRRCIYCGDKSPLPRGWDSYGNLSYCVKKGFGAGMHSERRKWQRRTGMRVDPEYVSPCGENAFLDRSFRRRGGRGRSRRR